MAEYTGVDYIEQAIEEIGNDPQFLPAGTNIGPRPRTSNAAYRAMMQQARQACNANGGFRVGSGGNFQCKFGQDAIDYIESLGENHPAYERGQQWLEDNPIDPNESTVNDDTTEQTAEDAYNEEIETIEQTVGTTIEDTIEYYEAREENAEPRPPFQEGYGPFTESSVIVLEDGTVVASDPRINPYGYTGGRDSIEVRGDIGDTSTGVIAEETLEDRAEQAEQAAEDAAAEEDEPPVTVDSVIEEIREAFPTWEDLWGSIQDQLPSDPQEWGGFIRGVIEAAGVDLPSGDVWEILNGGYGVTTDINPAMGGIAGILDPANQMVFVPGIPVGLPPNSMIIGSIEDLVTDPIGTITGRVEEVFGDIVQDPGGFVQDILAQGADVPPELWSVLIGGVQAGQEIIDWVTGAVSGSGEDATETTVAGTETTETTVPETTTPPETALAQSPQDRATGLLTQMQDQVQQAPQQTVTADDFSNINVGDGEGLTFGHQGGGSDDQSENVLSGGDNLLTLGGDSGVLSDGTITFTSDPGEIGGPNVITGGGETVLSGGSSSSGGAGGSSAFSPFWAGISYNTPTVAPIIPTPRVASLFKEYIG